MYLLNLFFYYSIAFIIISTSKCYISPIFIGNSTLSSNKISKRLEDKNNVLSQTESEELSFLLENKFPFAIIRLSTYSVNKKKSRAFYETLTYEFFIKHCKDYKDICEYGFLIEIFPQEKICVIQPGKESKKLIDDIYRKRIINSLRNDLNNKNYIQAIKKSLLFINYRQSNGKVNDFPETNDDPHLFIFYTMIPLFFFIFSALTLFLYFSSLKGIFSNDTKKFFDGIIRYWKNVPIEEGITIEKYTCIFCWEKTKNINEIFRYCGHSYHERCLRRWGIYKYAICPCSFEATEKTVDKIDGYNVSIVKLKIEDFKILLNSSIDAFSKQEIYDYFIINTDKIQEFKDNNNQQSLEDLSPINPYDFENYKTYRIFYKMWKVIRIACFFIIFYPKFLKYKKVRFVTRLFKIKKKGFHGGFH